MRSTSLLYACGLVGVALLAMGQTGAPAPSHPPPPDAGEVMAGMLFMLMFGLFFAGCMGINLLLIVLWIWALVDCVQRDFPKDDKLIWVLVVALTGWIGAIVYLVIGRPQSSPRPRSAPPPEPPPAPPPAA